MNEYQISKGVVVRTIMGGVTSLNNLLGDLKKYLFTGYVKIILDKDGKSRTGYIGVKEGKPVLSLYEAKEGDVTTDRHAGQASLKYIWEESFDENCTIELHGQVDIEEVMSRHPELAVSIGAKPTENIKSVRRRRRTPRGAKVGLAWGAAQGEEEREKQEKSALGVILKVWESKGYDLSAYRKIVEEDLTEAKKKISKFESVMRKIAEIERTSSSLETKSFNTDIEFLKSEIVEPSEMDEIERALSELSAKINAAMKEEYKEIDKELKHEKEERERQARVSQVYDLILRHKDVLTGATETKEGKKTEKCALCGFPLDASGCCPRCGTAPFVFAKAPEEDEKVMKPVEKVVEKIPVEVPPEANLLIGYTFDNFVIGHSNRFAHAAALAVAKNPSKAYNPLFIWSGAGLGKTHLLNAIGNAVVKNLPECTVIYTSTEKFTNELIRALQNNTLPKFREKYRSVEVLIVDDVQFLAGKERTQEEFFHTFNALSTEGKQIVLASDRPPKEITTLEERLISRFEGGLIADIQPPDFETRMAILRKKSEEHGISVPDEVLSHIAELIIMNIRELTGALNRVVAFSSMMKAPISLDLTKEVLKDMRVEEEIKKSDELAEKLEKELRPGLSYLIEEDRPLRCFKLLEKSVQVGMKGLCITRTNPKRVNERYELPDTSVLWLTDRESATEVTISYSLERLMYVLEEFINRKEKSIILLDGIEYLISNNSFDAVIRFMRRLIDTASESECLLLVSVSPDALKDMEIKLLEREMIILNKPEE